MERLPDELRQQAKKKIAKVKQTILKSTLKRKLFHGEREVDKKQILNKKIIEKKAGNADFEKNHSSKLRQIQKRTLFLVKLDKFDVRDKVDALRAFFETTTDQDRDGDSDQETRHKSKKEQASKQRVSRKDKLVHLSVTTSQTLPAVHIKPIKIPIECDTFTVENSSTGGLVLGKENEDVDKMFPDLRYFCECNRITVHSSLTY